MRPPHLLAGLLAAVPMAVGLTVAVRGQPAADMSRVLQWFDNASGLNHYASSQYPLPVRPPSPAHTTLPWTPLATGVAQVVVPAGSITNGCDITFSNSYVLFYLAYITPGALSAPNAAVGLGLQLNVGAGYNSVGPSNQLYHCSGPTLQGFLAAPQLPLWPMFIEDGWRTRLNLPVSAPISGQHGRPAARSRRSEACLPPMSACPPVLASRFGQQ